MCCSGYFPAKSCGFAGCLQGRLAAHVAGDGCRSWHGHPSESEWRDMLTATLTSAKILILVLWTAQKWLAESPVKINMGSVGCVGVISAVTVLGRGQRSDKNLPY